MNTSPLRILFIVPYPPSLIRVRAYNLIRHLTLLGHQVTVLTLFTGTAEQADAANLTALCHRVIALPLPKWRSLLNCLKALPTQKPLQAVYCWQPALADELAHLIGSNGSGHAFDVVHVEHLRGVEYALFLKSILAANGTNLPIVWDSVDCISHLFRQTAAASHSRFGNLAAHLDLARTERYEGWLANQFSRVLITSEIDKQAILDLVPPQEPKPEISLIPNGVDLDYFCPRPTANREPDTLVFSGKMSYHANVTMALYLAQEIMPRVWKQRPTVKLNIVGKAPPKQITALAQRPGINVTGLVPDIRPYLQGAAAAVVPLVYGAGVQFKILEAMACATPVVTTPQAVAPLSAEPGRDLLSAKDPEDFAQAILTLLSDPQMQQKIGANGRAYIEAHHNWTTITAQLTDIYRTATQRNG
ncbi:MAG: glycosyltransferase [Candidatus Promineifilaceae bacterium]